MSVQVPIGISARHVHLSQAHVEALFGPGYQLTQDKPLSQTGQFSCKETIAVQCPKGSFPKVRILGPVRKQTQVEISRSDSFALGVNPPLRESGNLAGTPGAKIVGPAGSVELTEGVIVSLRHLHLQTEEAAKLGLQDGRKVQVAIPGERGMVLRNILVRVRDDFAMDLHIDTDEANAAGVKNGDLVELIKE